MGLKAVATLVPGGGAPVGGSGTPGKLAKFATASSIGDSVVTELAGKIGINVVPGTLLSVGDGIVSPPSYDGIRLGNTAEALFSSSDSIRGFRAGVTGATVVAGSTTSHDLLLQRGNVTALTLGASGAVTFAGNLTSSAAQTWTLAAGSTSALNIQSGLLNLDTANSRVGIGTASPASSLSVASSIYNAPGLTNKGAVQIAFANSNGLSFGSYDSGSYSTYIQGISSPSATTVFYPIALNPVGGNVGIGTASPTDRLTISGGGLAITGNITGATTAANSLVMDNSGGSSRFYSIGASVSTFGNYVFNASKSGGSPGVVTACIIDQAAGVLLGPTSTAVFNASTSGQGLKLPATPGNTDPNTLDSYREGTRVLAAGDLSGWTYVTATQYWTLVGRTVTLHTIFTGGTSSATGGATIATPPLLTPLRIAAGAAVNSSGTALGNGVCVVASTSSTTGTVITSNAISSSAIDKVLTVTYETAGL